MFLQIFRHHAFRAEAGSLPEIQTSVQIWIAIRFLSDGGGGAVAW